MKVAILMGGNSSESEISLKTGQAVIRACESLGYTTVPCPYEKNIDEVYNTLKQVDIVFNALHGGDGEGGHLQKFLENTRILFTGSGSSASRLAMDKHKTKTLLKDNGILTPPWLFMNKEQQSKLQFDSRKFSIPVVVKPNKEGSTVGVSIVRDISLLDQAINLAFEFDNEILVEEYIPGRELTIGILDQISLPVIEIVPSHELYDYQCKYTKGFSQYICPAKLEKPSEEYLASLALKIHNLLGCRHYSRIDFRMNPEGNFYCLELNSLPGMTDTSLVPKAANAAGIPFEKLIEKILLLALNEKRTTN